MLFLEKHGKQNQKYFLFCFVQILEPFNGSKQYTVSSVMLGIKLRV